MKTTASATPDYSTRRKRRAAVSRLVAQLENIIAAEESCKNNIPLNLLGSGLYDTAEECICLLDEAAEILRCAYD
jgi:hypothetical protein